MAGAAWRSQTQIAALGKQHLPGIEGAPGRAGVRAHTLCLCGGGLGMVGDTVVTAASLHLLPW